MYFGSLFLRGTIAGCKWLGVCLGTDYRGIHRGQDNKKDTMTDNSSFVDLCGMDLPTQMKHVNESLKEASKGSTIQLITEHQMLATYILPKALEIKVKCKVSPVLSLIHI